MSGEGAFNSNGSRWDIVGVSEIVYKSIGKQEQD